MGEGLAYFRDRQVLVLGLGRSGRAAATALTAAGARVCALDDDPGSRARARAAGLAVADSAPEDLGEVAALILSPGIPHTHPAPHPLAARAHDAGLPVICEVDLMLKARPRATVVGITGTNGKSTTTALLGHLLAIAGRPAAVGGNLGTPALELPDPGPDGVHVLELSSYMLELVPSLTCGVAVLLNIAPDHLERHGGMDGYVTAKRRVFAPAHPNLPLPAAVIGIDDATTAGLHDALALESGRRVIPVSHGTPPLGGVGRRDGWLIDATGETPVKVVELARCPALKGRHNVQNAAAAVAAGRLLGLDHATLAKGLQSFPGLAHRQEMVATLDGITFINDSKATNADATATALACFEDVYWIVGGRPKSDGLAGLEPFYPRLRHAFLIGEAEDAFAATLTGAVPFTRCGTLDRAVPEAFARARAEGVANPTVLLSPACASWDQFADFNARGDAFKALVHRLSGKPENDLADKLAREASA
ncbi:UDP-N-acetylmuramoyl-L-alanine--D-glutamate ligase [Roseospirillum parvum]|uniref:UDP-N-acetylmuramoylalanine--D-glutamate ligase n=1 Tax=Roseospirillum parvum TaxID=83401 RepID=A0A1G7UBA3_9PROT|nr:UDP-N-acetylmuramoyl-L-alanine--D-glutamate ligase [Roseospirillum parvum]SDG44852.1 UDP-N-acetylmuramoylalanine--D-glutamate ligase [Roseospirillum parvum]